MRRTLVIAAALALLVTGIAMAQAPPERISIVALFDPIAYGEKTFVNGQLVGEGQGGQVVTLQAAAFPFTSWGDVAQMTTDPDGYYSFMRRPVATARYRTMWNGQVLSEQEVQVQVRPRLTIKAAKEGKSSLRFTGTLLPAHADQSVVIQRQSRSGSWRNVANARLKGGRSFAGRLRAHGEVRLRAFFASDGDHLSTYSAPVAVALGRDHGH